MQIDSQEVVSRTPLNHWGIGGCADRDSQNKANGRISGDEIRSRRLAWWATGGHPAAACKTGKERVRTTGPPVAKSRLTTHDDNSGQVSFVCSNNSLVVVGSGGRCLWVPSMQGIQQAIQTSLNRLRHSPAVKLFGRVPLPCWLCLSPELAPRAKQKVSASESLRGQGAVRRWVLSGARDGACGVRCEANVSPGIRPGDEQHADGNLSIGEGGCVVIERWVLPGKTHGPQQAALGE
jgi:hypothetical protein